MASTPHFRRSSRPRRRRLLAESLEDRRLLAVSFEFNYLGGNTIGFNDPVLGAEFRTAVESAASRLGNEILQDATIQMDVASRVFTGTAIATASSRMGSFPPGGGFIHRVIPAKIVGEVDRNGLVADGQIDVYFFDESDSFTYVTDPAEADAEGEIDLQAVIHHELVHTLGFTSNTRANGTDDAGDGLTTPGTWAPYDRYVSDVNGNRFIDADPSSPTAYQMDESSWLTHSVGGKGPDAGLFFDGPIATAVYGNRVPLYSPATFSLASSVSHLDSEGFPSESYVFSPVTHSMSHAIVTRSAPQQLTLVEKAILTDTGILMREDVPPNITTPQNIVIEANTAEGFTGSATAIDQFLAAAMATDVFDPSPTLEHDKPDTLVMGDNIITFTSTDQSGNVATATALITVVDTTPPTFGLPPTLTIHGNTLEGADLDHPDLISLLLASANDIADPTLTVTANLDSFTFGTQAVTFTVTDDAGNQASASTSLTITDNSLVISTLNDEDDPDPQLTLDDLSLREAIGLANENSDYSVIRFSDGLTGVVALDPLLGSLTITESASIYGLGSHATSMDAQGNSRVLDISGDGIDVLLSGVTITGGQLTGSNEGGAGILFDSQGTLSIQKSQVMGNATSGSGGVGGGILILAGDLSIDNSWIHSNQTGGPFAGGGGIWSRAPVSLTSSTISGNSTTGLGSHGGGVHLQLAALEVINSTVSGNATLGSDGAGIYSQDARLQLDFSTITDNHASGSGGGISLKIGDQSELQVNHSVIADNSDDGTAPDVDRGGLPNEAIIVRHSLVGDNRGTGLVESQTANPISGNLVGDILGVGILDPLLAPLADNGGPTPTHNPADTSPVLDAGDADFTVTDFSPALVFDQRGNGFDRVRGIVDIGAVETIPALQLAWDTPDAITYGTPLSSVELDAFANVPGQFLYTPPIGTILDAGSSQLLTALFTPQDPIHYTATEISVRIDVLTAVPTLTWNAPDPIVYGTPLSDIQLNAVADVAGVFTYTPPEGLLLQAGLNRQLNATFTPDSPNYQSVTESVLIDVFKATPEVTWSNPAPIVVGTLLDETQLNASSSNSGSFTYNPASGTQLEVGDEQVLSTTFTPADPANFNTVVTEVKIDVLAMQDFGDAPDNYPVLAADNGARHLPSALTLGSTIDSDANGQPSPNADGDGTDDDGVLQVASVIALANTDTKSSFQITSSGSGRLDAWIDFNADGDWQDTGEQIFSNVVVSQGDQLLGFTVPAGSSTGSTAARFRLSSSGGLAPTGPAVDGEVEDYLITIIDGNSLPDLHLNLSEPTLSLMAESDDLVIQSGSVELSRMPMTIPGSINIVGDAVNQTFSLDLSNGFPVPVNGIHLDGVTHGNTLAIQGDDTILDLTAPSVDIVNFNTIDLSPPDANQITLDTASIVKLSPLLTRLKVLKGVEDSLVFKDADHWRMSEIIASGEPFLVSAVHQISGEVVDVETPTPWQNFVQLGDINNDGQTSSIDALRIINELSRREYSEPESGELRDPLTLEFFPGVYFDHNGDGHASALDALRVINDLARAAEAEGEGELVISPDTSFQVAQRIRSGDRKTDSRVSVRLRDNDTKTKPTFSAVLSHPPLGHDTIVRAVNRSVSTNVAIAPSQADPSQTDPSQADPSQADPSLADQLLADEAFMEDLRLAASASL